MKVFNVPDMHCEGCIRSLASAVRQVDAGATLKADLDRKQVRVDSAVPPEQLVEAMRDAGFDAEAV